MNKKLHQILNKTDNITLSSDDINEMVLEQDKIITKFNKLSGSKHKLSKIDNSPKFKKFKKKSTKKSTKKRTKSKNNYVVLSPLEFKNLIQNIENYRQKLKIKNRFKVKDKQNNIVCVIKDKKHKKHKKHKKVNKSSKKKKMTRKKK